MKLLPGSGKYSRKVLKMLTRVDFLRVVVTSKMKINNARENSSCYFLNKCENCQIADLAISVKYDVRLYNPYLSDFDEGVVK